MYSTIVSVNVYSITVMGEIVMYIRTILESENIREALLTSSKLKVVDFEDADIPPEFIEDIKRWFPRGRLKVIVLDVGEVHPTLDDLIFEKSREIDGAFMPPDENLSFRYFRRTRGNDILKFVFYHSGSIQRMIVKAKDLYSILRKIDNLSKNR